VKGRSALQRDKRFGRAIEVGLLALGSLISLAVAGFITYRISLILTLRAGFSWPEALATTSAVLVALGTILLAVATIYLGISAIRELRESERTRIAEHMPFIMMCPQWDGRPARCLPEMDSWGAGFIIAIQNVGRGPALALHLTACYRSPWRDEADGWEVPRLNESNSLAPGDKVEIPLRFTLTGPEDSDLSSAERAKRGGPHPYEELLLSLRYRDIFGNSHEVKKLFPNPPHPHPPGDLEELDPQEVLKIDASTYERMWYFLVPYDMESRWPEVKIESAEETEKRLEEELQRLKEKQPGPKRGARRRGKRKNEKGT